LHPLWALHDDDFAPAGPTHWPGLSVGRCSFSSLTFLSLAVLQRDFMLDWQWRKRHMSAIHDALLAAWLVLALALIVAWGGLLAYGLIAVETKTVAERGDGDTPFMSHTRRGCHAQA
jgi:hypothetical protein